MTFSASAFQIGGFHEPGAAAGAKSPPLALQVE